MQQFNNCLIESILNLSLNLYKSNKCYIILLCMVIIGNYVHRNYSSFTGKHKIILYFMIYLLSEYMLCKESTVIMKKFDYEVLTISTFSGSWVETLLINLNNISTKTFGTIKQSLIEMHIFIFLFYNKNVNFIDFFKRSQVKIIICFAFSCTWIVHSYSIRFPLFKIKYLHKILYQQSFATINSHP